MTQAYRSAVGEGIRETARRAKVEVAATMLRQTAIGAADIAAAAGFCDQSHMIRCFLSVLGRTPLQVRAEWQDRSTVRSQVASGASRLRCPKPQCPLLLIE
jgi:transcriptional regulator GlxA family with amidase domain